ncbi:MAG: hypothetical protein K2Q18_10075 [Bdellovibrionales bacterium]|nr:hypothetical protein [Bdellovibrionales bacterium]
MTEEILKAAALEERKFLHDISNHIVVAHGMATFALRGIKNNAAVEAKEIERLEKALEAINKMTEALRERRAVLMAQST